MCHVQTAIMAAMIVKVQSVSNILTNLLLLLLLTQHVAVFLLKSPQKQIGEI